MEDPTVDDGEQNREAEAAPALIAVHPAHNSIAVAVGSELRVFNILENCPISLSDGSGSPAIHKDSIRAIRYGQEGKLFVSAGDDKLVKIWDTDSWRCLHSVLSEKRVSAVAIRNDGRFVCFADKFGVVYVIGIGGSDEERTLINDKPIPILAHYCSIITSLEFSPDGPFIVSADRDFKIRVTVFPKKPFDGAHEIQSFCLGHTEFVSCLAFVSSHDCPQGLLVSGSGDSTVRLWDFTSGSLHDSCNVGSGAGLLETNGRDKELLPAVTDLCAVSDGSVVAVAIQSLPGVMLLHCNLSARTLSIAKVVHVKGETFIPTSLAAAASEQLLWMVMGVSCLLDSKSAPLVRVRVLSGFGKTPAQSTEQETTMLEDEQIPGGAPLLQNLQGTLSIEKEAFSTAAEAVKTSMKNLLIKKQYSTEKRDFRKRGRNDRKMKK